MSDAGVSLEKVNAPEPDAPSKPQSPPDLHKPSWMHTLRMTMHQFTADQCLDLAAALTYFLVLSLFPGLLALVSLLGIFGQGEEGIEALLEIVRQLAPGNAVTIIGDAIEQFSNSPAVGFALVVGILGALWTSSGFVGAFARAMNRIYEIDEGRPFLKLRLTQLLVTLLVLVTIVIIAIILVISGPVAEAIGAVVGLGETAVQVWSIARWPVLVFAVVFLIAVLYYATPNIRQPKFRWMSVGAFLAVIILALASAGFGFYVANFGNYDRTYGSLGGVIVFLLWLWIANLALLFGAEFDSEMERSRQLQAGIAAEETLQLPPRDTAVSGKAADKAAADILEGRKLRFSRSREK